MAKDTAAALPAAHSHAESLLKELRPMLYGFGDAPSPHPASLLIVHDATLAYISSFLADVQAVSQRAGAPRIRLEDMMHVLRNDKKKVARVEELLFMNEDLKRARRAFEMEDGVGGNGADKHADD